MAAPISPIFKYSIVYNLLNFPPISIKFVSKFIVCKVLYFKTQCILRLRSPLNYIIFSLGIGQVLLRLNIFFIIILKCQG